METAESGDACCAAAPSCLRAHRRRRRASAQIGAAARVHRACERQRRTGIGIRRASPAGARRDRSARSLPLRDAHRPVRRPAAPIAELVGDHPPVDRSADLRAAHRHRTASGCSTRTRRPSPSWTPCGSSAWSSPTGRSGRVASIFYPASLLRDLGWPADADRLAAARARFDDLLTLPAARVAGLVVHARRGRDRVAVAVPGGRRARRPDVRAAGAPPLRPHLRARGAVASAAASRRGATAPTASAEWLARRVSRTPGAHASYHGTVGRARGHVYAVSRVERYLECPFKYFAGQVLQLEEEREDESGLTAARAGPVAARRLRGVLRGVARARPLRGLRRGSRRSARAVRGGGRAAAAGAAGGRPRARAHLSARLGRRAGTCRARLCGRDRAGHRRGGAAARVRVRRHVRLRGRVPGSARSRVRARRIASTCSATGRCGSWTTSSAGRRSRRGRCSCRSTGSAPAADLRRERGTRAADRPRRLRRLQGEERVRRPRRQVRRHRRRRCAKGSSGSSTRSPASRRGEYPPSPDEPWTCTRCGFPHVCRKDYVGDE